MSTKSLRGAVSSAALEARYQPVVRLHDGVTTGLEVLARLAMPGRELIAPDLFVPLVEEAGLIAEFTDAITRRALADLAEFGPAAADITLLINYPLDVLLVPEALERLVVRRNAAGVAADRLMVELTERHPVTDLPALARSMEILRAAGCRLALDDIVPDLPRLEALSALPFAMLKVDRSIVHAAQKPGAARDFVLRMRELSRARGQTMVAEGIEEPACWDMAHRLGFDGAQGYLISRPMAAADVRGWLEDRRQSCASAAGAAAAGVSRGFSR